MERAIERGRERKGRKEQNNPLKLEILFGFEEREFKSQVFIFFFYLFIAVSTNRFMFQIEHNRTTNRQDFVFHLNRYENKNPSEINNKLNESDHNHRIFKTSNKNEREYNRIAIICIPRG